MFVPASTRIFIFVVVPAATALAFLIVVMMPAAAALAFLIVVMVSAAAALAFLIVVMVPAAAAPAFLVVVMVPAAAALAFLIVVMVPAAAATAFLIVVMAAAAATATARMGTRQRNRHERLLNNLALQSHAFKHLTESVVGHHAESILRLRHANATGNKGVHRFLHQLMIPGNVHHLIDAGFHDVHGALFIHQHVTHFQGTHLTQRVFVRFAIDREFRRNLDSIGIGQHHALGTGQQRLRRTGLQGQKLRDFHRIHSTCPFPEKGAKMKKTARKRASGDLLILAKDDFRAYPAEIPDEI